MNWLLSNIKIYYILLILLTYFMRIELVGICPFDSNVSICSKSVSHARCCTEEKKSGKTCFLYYNGINGIISIVIWGEEELYWISIVWKKLIHNKQKKPYTAPKTMIAGDKHKIKSHITIIRKTCRRDRIVTHIIYQDGTQIRHIIWL